MTPATVAGLCRLAGLEVAALTDHNTCGNCPAFCAAAQAYGLLALPGMELSTLEEVHVVCLFPGLDRAIAFQELVYPPAGPPGQRPGCLRPAAPHGCGRPRPGGGAAACSPAPPTSASTRSTAWWSPSAAWPIRPTSTGPASPCCPIWGCGTPPWAFPWRRSPAAVRRTSFGSGRDLRGVPALTASDAHYPDQIQDAHQWMEVPARSTEAVLAWLRRGGM